MHARPKVETGLTCSVRTVLKERDERLQLTQTETTKRLSIDIPARIPMSFPALDISSSLDVKDESSEALATSGPVNDLVDPMFSLLAQARDYRTSRTTSDAAKFLTEGLTDSENELLSKWTHTDIDRVLRHQERYSDHRAHDCKRDLGPGLDPVKLHLVPESRVITLFKT